MNVVPMIFVAALVLAASIYAQHQIPRFTASPRTALLTRAGLIALGLVFGYVAADNLSEAGIPPLLTFLIGFGAVHVPAALILFLKHAAGAGKS
jgi:hypothetical protein